MLSYIIILYSFHFFISLISWLFFTAALMFLSKKWVYLLDCQHPNLFQSQVNILYCCYCQFQYYKLKWQETNCSCSQFWFYILTIVLEVCDRCKYVDSVVKCVECQISLCQKCFDTVDFENFKVGLLLLFFFTGINCIYRNTMWVDDSTITQQRRYMLHSKYTCILAAISFKALHYSNDCFVLVKGSHPARAMNITDNMNFSAKWTTLQCVPVVRPWAATRVTIALWLRLMWDSFFKSCVVFLITTNVYRCYKRSLF